MSMMPDIVEFLTARTADDEASAKAHLDEVALAIYNRATAHPRRKPCEDFATLPSLVQERYRALALESQLAPARVLAEVKAKRERLEQYVEVTDILFHGSRSGDRVKYQRESGRFEALDVEVRRDAALYDQHADYKQEWQVG